MEKRKSPKGFIVVLPGEIIEIPQDSDKSWLTLFYSLPRELAEKWKPAYDLPRCPYEVLRTDKYDHIVCDDMFKLLVWDCYAWTASAVHKRIAKIANAYEDYVTAEYQKYLDK